MINKEFINTVENWKTQPFHLDKYTELLSKFQSNLFREKEPEKFGQDLISYLLMEYTLYNITEENYFEERKTDDVFKALANTLIDSYGTKEDTIKFPKSYKKFFERFKDIIEDYPLYFTEITMPEYENIKIKIIDKRGKNRVSTSKSTFLVDTDYIFSEPETTKAVLSRFDKIYKKINNDFDKFCFIEKRKGPVGPSVLMGAISSKYDKSSVIYRPRHLSPLARVTGGQLNKNERICMVYDISFSGQGLKETAIELKQSYSVNPKYAIVVVDLQQEDPGAKSLLRSINVELHPIFEIPEEKIKETYKTQTYGNEIK